jgi:hypothetical protein
MPIEKRQILLSEDEVIHAIVAYRNVTPAFLPRGDILKLSVSPTTHDGPGGAEVTVTICMRYGSTEQMVDLKVDPADIVNLLIRFCLENNIPMPRQGTKATVLIDGMLALAIEYAHLSI